MPGLCVSLAHLSGHSFFSFHCYFHVFRTPDAKLGSKKTEDIGIIYGFEISSNFDFFTL
ncbi:hypothetical protein SBDP2_2160002 [Syntrophobacter sp. SbD2]|nr:hypothetical protein SBDP2_2160002 [Syntrophobacter sp. SbD2]